MRSPLFLLLGLFVDLLSAATERKFSPNGNAASTVPCYFVTVYLVTWPRISPPGLAAVCTLT
jgi:hypothetical protein